MKILYLIRHAKSSWAFDLPDHDRPLGKRGRKDVLKMGAHLNEHQPKPEVFISSSASRAFYTALHICDQLSVDEGHIILEKKLFHADSDEILEVIQSAPSCDRLAIFGHNPAFTSVSNLLAKTNIDNIPTCGAVGISFNVMSWEEVVFGLGEQLFFVSPKGI